MNRLAWSCSVFPKNHPDFELLKNESGLARHAVELPDPGISLKDTLAMFRKLREELTRLGTPCDDDALTTALVRSNLARYRYSELEEKVFSAKSFLQYSDLLAVSLFGTMDGIVKTGRISSTNWWRIPWKTCCWVFPCGCFWGEAR